MFFKSFLTTLRYFLVLSNGQNSVKATPMSIQGNGMFCPHCLFAWLGCYIQWLYKGSCIWNFGLHLKIQNCVFGPVLKLLSNVGISALNCLYTPAYIIELEMSIHIHWSNGRHECIFFVLGLTSILYILSPQKTSEHLGGKSDFFSIILCQLQK